MKDDYKFLLMKNMRFFKRFRWLSEMKEFDSFFIEKTNNI